MSFFLDTCFELFDVPGWCRQAGIAPLAFGELHLMDAQLLIIV